MDLVMFFEVYHIPLLLALALSLNSLKYLMLSADKYFSEFLDSSAYPSLMIFSLMLAWSLNRMS